MTTIVMDKGLCGDNWDPALSRLLSSLKEVQGGEDVSFLSELLQSKQLHALVHVHNKIVAKGKDDRFFPLLSNSMEVALEVLELISETPFPESSVREELFKLLQTPHMQGILCAHDAIAQKDYYPHLPEVPPDSDDNEETVKIVQLVKSDEPLGGAQSAEPIVGATIKTDEETGKIVIARVMHGGAADRSGLIHAGDEVVEVNGINVELKTPADVLAILQNSEGTITFKLVPSYGKLGMRESKVRVRAHFDYLSSADPYIPCKEAGLDFKKGDVLHIVSQDDAYWWQARREGDKVMRAGLIPSRALQEGRIIFERQSQQTARTLDGSICSAPTSPVLCNPAAAVQCARAMGTIAIALDNENKEAETDAVVEEATDESGSIFPCKPSVKVKKIMYDLGENDDFDREAIPTYEEVGRLYPRPGLTRPLVLIGAPGVGRNELKRRLVATDPDKYKSPVPFTSRPQKPGEQNGKEYIFVTRERMEQDITGGKFIEFGEYKGNLYGTSSESVETIVNAGFVCVLCPHQQALKVLRTPSLRPFVIYIKPPIFEELRETRAAMRARSTFDESNSRGFTDDEMIEILRASRRIEFLYGHFFDEEIVNGDLATSLAALLKSAWKVQTEPLWVPATWVQ